MGVVSNLNEAIKEKEAAKQRITAWSKDSTTRFHAMSVVVQLFPVSSGTPKEISLSTASCNKHRYGRESMRLAPSPGGARCPAVLVNFCSFPRDFCFYGSTILCAV